jgi:hypothetical protein
MNDAQERRMARLERKLAEARQKLAEKAALFDEMYEAGERLSNCPTNTTLWIAFCEVLAAAKRLRGGQ